MSGRFVTADGFALVSRKADKNLVGVPEYFQMSNLDLRNSYHLGLGLTMGFVNEGRSAMANSFSNVIENCANHVIVGKVFPAGLHRLVQMVRGKAGLGQVRSDMIFDDGETRIVVSLEDAGLVKIEVRYPTLCQMGDITDFEVEDVFSTSVDLSLLYRASLALCCENTYPHNKNPNKTEMCWLEVMLFPDKHYASYPIKLMRGNGDFAIIMPMHKDR